MKLKIGAKVNVLMVVSLVIVGGISLFFSISALKHQGKLSIDEYRTGVMEEKKEFLKNMVIAAHTIAQEQLKKSTDKERLRKSYGDKIKVAINQAFVVFFAAEKNEDCGTLEKKKEYAKNVIEKMRWGADGKGYFWIQDTDGNMVMHPIKPSLNGKPLFGLKDPDGKLFFKEFDNVAKEKGAGFVDYKWPKPGSDEPVDKISYVKLFKDWGWIIGGGLYLESTAEFLKEDALQSIGSIRYGKGEKGYFFIQNSKGINILHPIKPELQGKNMINAKDPNGKFFLKELNEVAEKNKQGGFVSYMWPKPGSEEPVEKLAFCKRLEGWDWNIGTGIYVDDVIAALAKKENEVKRGITKAIAKIAIIVILIMIAAIALSYFVIVKGVVGPIKRIIEMLKDIAEGEGDLTKRIADKSGDETEELAEWFNKFIGNTQEMISIVKQDSEKLNESSMTLSEISEHMSKSAETTSSKANTVAAASEEMTANLSSVAAAMEQATGNVNMVASASEEMSSTINEIAQNAEKARGITDDAVTKTSNASAQIDELSKAAKEIGQVVESITDISEQVNLLALNATIEAARAGEAGKGFAVVANEIKDLAKQTAESSNEIKERVSGIQNSTDNTITEIASISKVVTEINEIVGTIATAVEEQSATTKEINENVAQVSAGIEEVNNNVSEGSTASQEVTNEITEVDLSAKEIADSSSKVKIDAEKLSKLSQNLADMMSKFKV
ncbi:MAG: cache domain-containing protein [Desulfobacteraceae bacterium]|nr:cache domain-containing protein [Desulfobacteraceae bacterium]